MVVGSFLIQYEESASYWIKLRSRRSSLVIARPSQEDAGVAFRSSAVWWYEFKALAWCGM